MREVTKLRDHTPKIRTVMRCCSFPHEIAATRARSALPASWRERTTVCYQVAARWVCAGAALRLQTYNTRVDDHSSELCSCSSAAPLQRGLVVEVPGSEQLTCALWQGAVRTGDVLWPPPHRTRWLFGNGSGWMVGIRQPSPTGRPGRGARARSFHRLQVHRVCAGFGPCVRPASRLRFSHVTSHHVKTGGRA